MGCAASTPVSCILGRDDPPAGADQEKDGPTALRVSRAPREAPATEKLVLLGESGVGKSSILQKLESGEEFDPLKMPPQSTLVTSFRKKTIEVAEEGCSVTLEIWDTAGQERFCAMAPLYYRGAAAALIVYDITSPSSFERARFWVKELACSASPHVLIALVGNKADLHSQRRVTPSAAHNFASLQNIPLVLETSALSFADIHHLFQEVCRRLIIARRSSTSPPSPHNL